MPPDSPAPSWLPPGRPLTVDDLETLPDDGHRYELIDGMLLVSPAPGTRHQKVVLQTAFRLEQVCPDDLHVLAAPYAVRPSNTVELQPDVLVARDEDLTDRLLPVAPVLAVEVLSPSSALSDLNYKKAAYQRLGVPSYWVIDPQEPTLVVFELDEDGRYELVAEVKDQDAFEATRPFPVRIVPTELLGRLGQSRM
ncbi:Uma2 family endonuclease [Solihabitans fulvus]|uniref:Uma2 family endonuclease n=1 Tax=Solihabitans fulvus TaxID=1892852 RepID=A0A5B2XTE0_9PSEU|nr:Uma2 family endonuclease [Solihabitans fulvus]KAA2266190.1 Uma2 family endonuclease [Solihabitans fulvus]